MRLKFALAAVVVATLVTPSAAQAAYYISQKKAESYVRDHLRSDVGYRFSGASCRPKGRSGPEAGYIYHTWVCGFSAGDSRYGPSCTGQARIKGSSEPGTFYYRVLHADGPCPKGADA